MKRITLAALLTAVVATMAAAQDPVPPTPPTPPARPVPAPAAAPAVPTPPMPAPRAQLAPLAPLPPMDRWDLDDIREQAREASRAAIEAQRIDVDAVREQAREASRAAIEAQRIDIDAVREQAREASRTAVDAQRIADGAVRSFAPIAPIGPIDPRALAGSEGFAIRTAPAPWAQGDPADSLYRVARNALTSGDYGRAAQLFASLSKTYPKSAYAEDAPYFEATARYRIGTTDELRTAAKVLEPLVARISPNAASNGQSRPVSFNGQYMEVRRNASDNDVAALYARINGVLAQRGDRDAADKVAKAAAAAGAPTCDEEFTRVQVEALNALSQMDQKQAAPLIRKVLDRKDECSVSLRQNAVFMLGRRADTESG
ncbi:MAG TPA: outer membrane protein assembly factor BamD, partial [Gemmatimonadaceae bacterium]|nr:outer membrane protein assembly factor BamD [Gemmatimonadaceae bacterium]